MDSPAPPAAVRFKIASCRGDHAGNAYVTLQHETGAHLAIHHLPFQQNAGETSRDEQYRMLQEAAGLVREAMEFLLGQTRETLDAPLSEQRVGPAPHEGEPPNPFALIFGRR